MSVLLLLCLMLSVASLIVALLRPALLKMPSRRRAGVIFGSAVVIFLVLFNASLLPSEQQANYPENSNRSDNGIPNIPGQPVPSKQSESSLSLITEPDDGIAPIAALIQGASRSIDLVMYELNDEQLEDDLAAAEKRGVAVRVLLNEGYYGVPSASSGKNSISNAAAFVALQAVGVAVRWTPAAFALTHQKTMIIDGTKAVIMTFNLTPQYYVTSRDFGIIDADKADVNAMETVFNEDWSGEQTASMQGVATGQSVNAETGDGLIWSPGAKSSFLALIQHAAKTLDVENEELADTDIINALAAAAKRGVAVRVVMSNPEEWTDELKQLAAADVGIRTYATDAALYIHAKVIIADGSSAIVGSQNFSATSLNNNREVSVVLADASIINSLTQTFQSDWSGGEVF